ncbi:MAG: hypothetical protein ACREQL_03260 [Candidatus Binatia bacterium]
MIRRTTLVALAALAALFVVAGTTHATTDTTRTCIRTARKTLQSCRLDCSTSFRTRQAQCFGPGVDCAQKCQIASDGCRGPLDTQRKVCLSGDDSTTPPTLGCADVLRQGLDECRERFDRGEITDLDACANQKRLANLECVLGCSSSLDELYLACNNQFSQCLAACASCATPAECPR